MVLIFQNFIIIHTNIIASMVFDNRTNVIYMIQRCDPFHMARTPVPYDDFLEVPPLPMTISRLSHYDFLEIFSIHSSRRLENSIIV